MLTSEERQQIANKAKAAGLKAEIKNYSLFIARDDEKQEAINNIYRAVCALGGFWQATGHTAYRAVGKHSSHIAGTYTAYQVN